jgi:hypothetical protein
MDRSKEAKDRELLRRIRVKTRTHKKCTACGELKPASEFHANPVAVDGKHSWCKECDARRRR